MLRGDDDSGISDPSGGSEGVRYLDVPMDLKPAVPLILGCTDWS
jgi:hypothetical protein